MSTHLDHVSLAKKANTFVDGKCIFYNLTFPDHVRKTIGVILPSSVRMRMAHGLEISSWHTQ